MIRIKYFLFLLGVAIFGSGCMGASNITNGYANNANTTTNTIQNTAVNGTPTAQMQNESGDKKPPQSPPATAEAVIANRKITINYSAPSMRGRKIMGELVPFGKVWRTGANAATTLITEADVKIGELLVPKGTYTIYTVPGQTDWKLIINKQSGQWGTVYNEDQDLGRVDIKVKEVTPPVEQFVIALNRTSDKGGLLTMTWENTEASVPFTIMQ